MTKQTRIIDTLSLSCRCLKLVRTFLNHLGCIQKTGGGLEPEFRVLPGFRDVVNEQGDKQQAEDANHGGSLATQEPGPHDALRRTSENGEIVRVSCTSVRASTQATLAICRCSQSSNEPVESPKVRALARPGAQPGTSMRSNNVRCKLESGVASGYQRCSPIGKRPPPPASNCGKA